MIHHGFLAGGGIQKEIAGDPVDGRGHAGDDRNVIWIGEAGHGALSDGGEALRHQAAEVREQVPGEAIADVGGVAAVDQDDDHGRLRPAIAPAVRGNLRGVLESDDQNRGEDEGREEQGSHSAPSVDPSCRLAGMSVPVSSCCTRFQPK